MTKLFLAITILALHLQAKAQLEVPPTWPHQKITTPHFEIIYNANQQALAELYALKLEKAHTQLSKIFSLQPEKTVVVINDKTDVTNGYATRIPYPHIMAFPVLPSSQDSLSDSGDWPLEFLGHEYTHVLNFEPAIGTMGTLRSIFGTALAPNLLLPTWWKEGLAVHMETTLGTGGRLRSPYQDGVIRSWEIENRWDRFDIASANEALPDWPRGMTPYILGSLFWAQTAQEYSNSVIDRINLRHGERVPYFIEKPAQEIFQKSYTEQYNETIRKTRVRISKQLETLRQESPSKFTFFAPELQYSFSPAVSPNSEYLAIIGVDHKDKRGLYIYKRDVSGKFSSKELFFKTSDEAQSLRWSSDSSKILFDKVSALNRYETRSDLWTLDLQTRKSTRLTKGWRAREPAYSPDNNIIAFVQLRGGATDLTIYNLKENTTRVLYKGELMERVSFPEFLDNNNIIFSSRRLNSKDRLIKLNIESPNPEEVLPQFENARIPKYFEGQLFFTSSINGVHNIYSSSDNLKSAQAKTHTLTAINSFSIDPLTKDLWTTTMTADGPQLTLIQFADLRSTPANLPKVQPLFADLYPEPNDSDAKDPSLALTHESYSPWSYLLPRYWIPFISGSTTGGTLLQASTSAFDPLKKHSYSLSATFDTATSDTSVLGQYINQTTLLPFAVTLSRLNSYLGSTNNELIDNTAQLAVLPDTFELSENTSAQIGWQFIERTTNVKSVRRAGPFVLFGYESLSQGGHEIAPTQSRSAYVGMTSYIKGDRSYISHSRYIAGASVYTDRWLPERHSLSLKINAVYTPETINATYGVQSESTFLYQYSNLPSYVVRGYAAGLFFGKNMAVTNIDYQFPLKDLYKGNGTDPYFLRRLSAAATVDSIAVDGYVADLKKSQYVRTSMHHQFHSFGGEVRMDSTIGYLIPIRFVVGYYLTPQAPDKTPGSMAFSLQISGF